jgi:predicted RNase H-like nuclease (RuvC/YqgF family)
MTTPHTHVLRYFNDEGRVFCLQEGCKYEISAGQLLTDMSAMMAAALEATPLKDYVANLEAENDELRKQAYEAREKEQEAMRLLANVRDTTGKTVMMAEKLSGRVKALEAENAELRAIAEQAVSAGSAQAAEWDKFWEALGVASSDITVDQAIAKWKALQSENASLRAALAPVAQVWTDWMVERERKGSPFQNINQFSTYSLCGSQINSFKEAAKLLEPKP